MQTSKLLSELRFTIYKLRVQSFKIGDIGYKMVVEAGSDIQQQANATLRSVR